MDNLNGVFSCSTCFLLRWVPPEICTKGTEKNKTKLWHDPIHFILYMLTNHCSIYIFYHYITLILEFIYYLIHYIRLQYNFFSNVNYITNNLYLFFFVVCYLYHRLAFLFILDHWKHSKFHLNQMIWRY